MARSISRSMISSFESGRLARTSSSHSSRKASSELFASSSGKVRLLEKFLNRSRPFSISLHGVGKFAVAEKDRSLGARVHHQDVGTKLLEAPDQLPRARCVRRRKLKRSRLRCVSRITRFEIVDLKETQVAMVILDAFLLQFAALLGREKS